MTLYLFPFTITVLLAVVVEKLRHINQAQERAQSLMTRREFMHLDAGSVDAAKRAEAVRVLEAAKSSSVIWKSGGNGGLVDAPRTVALAANNHIFWMDAPGAERDGQVLHGPASRRYC